MGTGSSKIGKANKAGGVQNQQSSGNLFRTDDLNNAVQKYQDTANRYAKHAQSNPNNLTYAQGRDNMQALADTAKNMNPSAINFDGLDAVVMMNIAPVGTEVQISGNIFPGTYKLDRVRTGWGTSGFAWVQQGGNRHSFAMNPDTLAGELRMNRGGKYTVTDKSASVRILKKG